MRGVTVGKLVYHRFHPAKESRSGALYYLACLPILENSSLGYLSFLHCFDRQGICESLLMPPGTGGDAESDSD